MGESGQNLEGKELSEQERAEQKIGPQVNFRPNGEDKVRLLRLMERTGLGITEVVRLSLTQTERYFPSTRPLLQVDRRYMRQLIGLTGILRAFCQATICTMQEQQVSTAAQRLWVQNLLAALHNPLHLCSVLAEYLDLEQSEVFLHQDSQHYLQYREVFDLLARQYIDMSSRHQQKNFIAKQPWDEPSFRLFSDDILLAYQAAIPIDAEEQTIALESLRQSVIAFLPRALLQAKEETV